MFAQQLAVSGGQAIVMQIYSASALDGKNALSGWALDGLGYTVEGLGFKA